jgi:NADPH:quinone reductase-like Zn-dependent oxidoreductase
MQQLPERMAAVLLLGHGDYGQLAYRLDVPRPNPGPGEVLIQVAAAGVNNTDINTRIGWYSPSVRGDTAAAEARPAAGAADGDWTGGGLAFPRIQGADVCGRIVAVGAGVASERLGQRVIVQGCLVSRRQGNLVPWLGSEVDGGFAQFVVAPAADSHAVETPLSDAELAALPCAYGTAENLLHRARVAAGETVLVTGASGGVGAAAVQLARRRGASVIAICGADKQGAVQALGAARTVARGAPLPPALGADSVDCVIDLVGGPQWPELLEVLRPGGRYAVSGAIAGPIVELDLRRLYLKDLTLQGCTTQEAAVFRDLVGYVERGEIRPPVAATYPLAEIVRAQQEFLTKRHVGKLVLIPPPL